jgi:Tfp pilus assembly protein PilO
MENKDLQNPENENNERESEILRNDEVNPHDSAVVIEEDDRTVLLTEDETLVIEKEDTYTITPSDRPRKPYAGMWGIPEIVTVGLAALTVLTLLLIYLFLVLPADKELEQNRAKRDELEKELVSARKKFGNITDTESQVAKLVNSVSDFEMRFLKDEAIGKTSIYQRINALINAYGLVNTTGPDYAPLEISEEERRQGGDSAAQRGRSKFQSLFPGVYVTMTVEGSYLNLRRFIRDIEASQEFLVISSIELEPAEDNESEDGGVNTIVVTEENVRGERIEVRKPAPPSGKTHGQTVSLRLELAAYFQRESNRKVTTALPERDEPLDDAVQ